MPAAAQQLVAIANTWKACAAVHQAAVPQRRPVADLEERPSLGHIVHHAYQACCHHRHPWTDLTFTQLEREAGGARAPSTLDFGNSVINTEEIRVQVLTIRRRAAAGLNRCFDEVALLTRIAQSSNANRPKCN
jgi:hypothetical protein